MGRKSGYIPAGDSPVQQGDAPTTDINRMVESARRNSVGLPAGARQPMYGDFTRFSGDAFRQAQELRLNVFQAFSSLPSGVRNRFDNNPELMINWVNDPQNAQEAVKLGLRLPPEVKPPTPGQEIAEALAPLLRKEGVQVDLEDESKKRGPQAP